MTGPLDRLGPQHHFQVIAYNQQPLYVGSRKLLEASGENCNFEVFVVTPAFAGMSALKRQQSILGLFSEELKTGKLHALGVRAKTPEELANTPNNLVQLD